VFLGIGVATLILGVTAFNDTLALVWASIGASALAMIFLLTSILRRKPVQPATAGAPYGPTPEEAAVRGRPAAAAATATPAAAAPTAPAPPAPSQRRPAAAPTGAVVPPPSAAPEAAPAPEAVPTPTAKTTAAKTTARKPAAKKPAAKKPAAKRTAAKKTAAKKTAAAGTSSRTTVVAIPERGTFHTSACRYVQDRDDTERVQLGTAKNRGYTACKVCKPES
jgi:outer membrane biosynthesis protein TonB